MRLTRFYKGGRDVKVSPFLLIIKSIKEMEKPFKLPKEFAEKWIDALRSGAYTQGDGFLKNYPAGDFEPCTHCCLGVAIEMLDDKVHIDGLALPDEVRKIEGFPEILRKDTEYLRKKVFDLPGDRGQKTVEAGPISFLTSLNDGMHMSVFKKYMEIYPEVKFRGELEKEKNVHYTFEQIAEFIEDNFEFV